MSNSTPHGYCRDNPASGKRECGAPCDHNLRGLTGAWKAAIPSHFRDYNPDTKVWRFWGGYEDVAATILLRFHPDADVSRSRQRQTQTSGGRPANDHFAVLHLLPSAPREVVDAAFRALAKRAHPDHGGTDAAMLRLTEAHDALSRGLIA